MPREQLEPDDQAARRARRPRELPFRRLLRGGREPIVMAIMSIAIAALGLACLGSLKG